MEFKNRPGQPKETISFDDEGICAACRYQDIKDHDINWVEREAGLNLHGALSYVVPASAAAILALTYLRRPAEALLGMAILVLFYDTIALRLGSPIKAVDEITVGLLVLALIAIALRIWQTPGEILTIASRRGSISLYARADDGMPRGAVFVPFCYYEAAANLLTNPVLDPFGKIPEFKYCAVKVTPGGATPERLSFGGGSLLRSPGNARCKHQPNLHFEFCILNDT